MGSVVHSRWVWKVSREVGKEVGCGDAGFGARRALKPRPGACENCWPAGFFINEV